MALSVCVKFVLLLFTAYTTPFLLEMFYPHIHVCSNNADGAGREWVQ